MALVKLNEVIAALDRRLYREDNTRLFVGLVRAVDGSAIRAEGYAFYLDPYQVSGTGRRGERRVRLLSLTAGEVIYVLPEGFDVETTEVRFSPKSLVLTSGAFSLDLDEWLYRG